MILRKCLSVLPNPIKKIIRRFFAIISLVNLPIARIKMMTDLEPLSVLWGSDRGIPIHRYYLEKFLQEFITDIQGHCLEFQAGTYTRRFGRDNVSKLDIIHIDDSNSSATIIADITKANNIPDDSFDCIICTHVLHMIYDLDIAAQELFRILKPGGVLFAVVPQTSMCEPKFHEVWRFTSEGLFLLFAKVFGEENVIMKTYGNSLTAAGDLRGLVVNEFTKSELDHNDERFALEVCARVTKQR